MPFDRTMNFINVLTQPGDRKIWIEDRRERSTVFVDVDLVDTLIKWLQEAKQTALTELNYPLEEED